MLNYLTLWIKEEDIRKDLVNHIIEQRVFIHWVAATIAGIILVIQLILYKYTNDLLLLIGNIIYFIGLGPVNTIFLFKFKKGLRWTSSAIMFCQSIFLVYASSPYGTKIASSSSQDRIFLQILGAYLVTSVVTCQSDFWTVCLIQCPVFIVAAILISYFKNVQTTMLLS